MMSEEEVNRLLFCLVAILLVLLLTSCAAPPMVEPRVVVQTVDRPVSVSCLGTVPPAPQYETGYLDADTADGEVLLEMARNWAKSQAYEAALQASMTGCELIPK